MEATVVLGGTGFLGAHVVAAAHGWANELATFAEPSGPPVTGIGRRPEHTPRFSNPRDGARFQGADLAPEGAAAELLDTLQPRIVIACAALGSLAACEEDPGLARRMNVGLATEVARWCANADARLVHVSTDQVFGAAPPPSFGFVEDDPPAPTSVYGETKAEGEAALLEAYPDALIVRLPLLYGDSGGRELGASDRLVAAVHRGERPELFLDEYRTPLAVVPAAEALMELALGDARGVLHVAGPDRVSRHALGLAILDAMGLDPQAAAVELRAVHQADVPGADKRPADVSLDASRASALLETRLPGVLEGTRQALR
jgi:dTDP-4-dehydrorhamnose reductase